MDQKLYKCDSIHTVSSEAETVNWYFLLIAGQAVLWNGVQSLLLSALLSVGHSTSPRNGAFYRLTRLPSASAKYWCWSHTAKCVHVRTHTSLRRIGSVTLESLL